MECRLPSCYVPPDGAVVSLGPPKTTSDNWNEDRGEPIWSTASFATLQERCNSWPPGGGEAADPVIYTALQQAASRSSSCGDLPLDAAVTSAAMMARVVQPADGLLQAGESPTWDGLVLLRIRIRSENISRI